MFIGINTGEINLLFPQAEFYISQTSESCLGILNNMYNDSVAWVSRKQIIYLFIRFTSCFSFSTILVRTVIRRNMTFFKHLFFSMLSQSEIHLRGFRNTFERSSRAKGRKSSRSDWRHSNENNICCYEAVHNRKYDWKESRTTDETSKSCKEKDSAFFE